MLEEQETTVSRTMQIERNCSKQIFNLQSLHDENFPNCSSLSTTLIGMLILPSFPGIRVARQRLSTLLYSKQDSQCFNPYIFITLPLCGVDPIYDKVKLEEPGKFLTSLSKSL